MKKICWIWILTGLVVLIAIFLIFLRISDFESMSLGEIADFTSVFVAALAFLWLIYGYQIQAKELSLQRREIKNQVKNSERLAIQAEKQSDTMLELLQFEEKRFNESYINQIRPILVFSSNGGDKNRRGYWVVNNVGTAPALNVVISSGKRDFKWIEDETVLFPSLSPNNPLNLTWTKTHGALLAKYSDLENNVYTTICADNKNTIEKGDKYPALKAKIFEYQLRKAE